jgi:hypothetical protein
MGKRVRRPSPAMVVALLALCLALGGTAVAATKLSKNAVKTKNIKNGAVTESKIAGNAVTEGKIAGNAVTEGKIASGAVSQGKLGASAKAIWVETELGSNTDIKNQSGGVTITDGPGNGQAIVNFGTDITNRAITVTPSINLGSVDVEYGRCVDIGCGASTDNPNAINVLTFASDSGTLADSGFLAVALP